MIFEAIQRKKRISLVFFNTYGSISDSTISRRHGVLFVIVCVSILRCNGSFKSIKLDSLLCPSDATFSIFPRPTAPGISGLGADDGLKVE